MKIKDLIELLQKADPTGEQEVVVGNSDIHFIAPEPAYYDGCLQVLIRDENFKGYNVIGAKVVSIGTKVVIHTISVTDALWENPELPIDYSGVTEAQAKRYKEAHEKIRNEVREFESQIKTQGSK